MKRILAFPIPMGSNNPMTVQGIVRFDGDAPEEQYKVPEITYINVEDDVDVNYGYLVTRLEDGTYQFTKPETA